MEEIRYYIQPSWSEKKFYYTDEEAESLMRWRKIEKETRSKLKEMDDRREENLKQTNSRFWEKLCCNYCCTPAVESFFVCGCREERNKYYDQIDEAVAEIMKIRNEEFIEWGNQVEQKTNKSSSL